MPKPALGRIVHVFVDPARNNGGDIAPAMITRVWKDQGVNLKVVLDGPEEYWLTSVALYDDRESAEQVTTYRICKDGRRIPAAAFWPPIV
jgi:hypothetical protein